MIAKILAEAVESNAGQERSAFALLTVEYSDIIVRKGLWKPIADFNNFRGII